MSLRDCFVGWKGGLATARPSSFADERLDAVKLTKGSGAAFELFTDSPAAVWLAKAMCQSGRACEWRNPILQHAKSDEGVIFSPVSAESARAGEEVATALELAPRWATWVIEEPLHEGRESALMKAHPEKVWRIPGDRSRVFASNFRVEGAVYLSEVRAERELRIVKGIEPGGEERYILGIVLEPEVVDSQLDIYSAEEIRQAAHRFMEEHQTIGFMHRGEINSAVKIVESYLAPADLQLGGQSVKAGTWLLGVRVLDEKLWKAVKAGELTGFSIGGIAQRIPARAAPGSLSS